MTNLACALLHTSFVGSYLTLTIRLEILDTAGQEDFTALRDQWIRECDGYVLVYDTTCRSSFDQTSTLSAHFVSLITLPIALNVY